MLIKIWNFISFLGITPDLRDSEKRNVTVTNRIILILFLLSILFAFISSLIYSMDNLSMIIVLGYTIAFLITLIFNRSGYTVLCRVFLSFFLPAYTLFASIYFKILEPASVQGYQFYASRIIILVFAVLPIIYLDLKDRIAIILSLAGGFLTIILFDPIHEMLNVGYYDLGFTDDRYSFINVVMVLTYALFFGTMIFLKRLIEQYELRNHRLISALKGKNNVLNSLNKKLETSKADLEEQKEELRSQKEELTTNQEKLMELNTIIDDQKDKLELINKDLSYDLEIKNKHLIQANNELVRNNNELRQFSYTISHNLRGPLASLMGLTELLEEKKYDEDTKNIIHFIKDSVSKLDETIQDLNKVLDIRNSFNQIREKVMIEEEIKKVLLGLNQDIQTSGITINQHIDTKQVYSVRAIIHSLLYNLISNAIKFRSHDRDPEITITSEKDGENLVLKVIDNGLGIDLEFYKTDLFKMYKRFHLHTEGRGMGLYLTHLQVELLNGKIEVESKQNYGTEFKIILPLEINKVLVDNAYLKVSYDLILNCAILQWKQVVDSMEFRDMLNNVVDILSNHKITSWISDIRERGEINPSDIQWMFEKVFPKAITKGIKNVLIVSNETEGSKDLQNKFNSKVENVDLKVYFFKDLEITLEWLKQESGTLL